MQWSGESFHKDNGMKTEIKCFLLISCCKLSVFGPPVWKVTTVYIRRPKKHDTSSELIGSLKLGNVCVFVQLISWSSLAYVAAEQKPKH